MAFQPSYTWGYSITFGQSSMSTEMLAPFGLQSPCQPERTSGAMLEKVTEHQKPFHGTRSLQVITFHLPTAKIITFHLPRSCLSCQETPNQQGWHQCISLTLASFSVVWGTPMAQVPNKARPSQALNLLS